MNVARISRQEADPVGANDRPMQPLGRYLVDHGRISASQLVSALERQKTIKAPLGEILVAEGLITRQDVMDAIAAQRSAQRVDMSRDPPDPDLVRIAPPSVWLKHCCLPWARVGDAILIACARPDRLDALREDLPDKGAVLVPVLALPDEILSAISQRFGAELARDAEVRVRPEFSCRAWSPIGVKKSIALAAASLLAIALIVALPLLIFSVVCLTAIVCLFLITALKAVGGLAHLSQRKRDRTPKQTLNNTSLPSISVMVPLYRETEIAEALITRLQRLTYPKALLDIVLVLEEKDQLTRAALEECSLPDWMRVVEVPCVGSITTKPRALNYALDYCRGDIIGIWDAEDAPAPGQLHHVAAGFARAEPDVACLQGILDFYNPRANWLSRCFTIEYASWFRVVLPGLARLGLVIPLGGTTLFLRREAILAMGGWDAHNVTEDADLGVRIARFGYRTEFIATPTHEEANCRPWQWVKQRSRWLKGFLITYCVHMRRPRKLLTDLGLKRFLGLQAFFIGTLSQFMLAPILWTFWLKLFEHPHTIDTIAPPVLIAAIVALFVTTELVNLSIALVAVSREEHRSLMPWALTMPLYFPLGTLASYKALYEVMRKPFFWDKTQHGHSQPDPDSPVPAPD